MEAACAAGMEHCVVEVAIGPGQPSCGGPNVWATAKTARQRTTRITKVFMKFPFKFD
jgi:hypothetical protein